MLMTDRLWNDMRYFSKSEKWGDPDKMDSKLIYQIDYMRDYIDRPVHIHCGFEDRNAIGYHPKGLAADLHIEGLSVFDQFILASRFGFTGIGLYPIWNNQGLHVDMRPIEIGQPRKVWGCNAPGNYVAVNKSFITICL